jgi:hypothetical protein
MNIRYFFIVDRVKAGDLRIEHCLTEEMIGDFFTKPLQGFQFYKLRDDIMNVDPHSAYHLAHRSVLSPSPIVMTTDHMTMMMTSLQLKRR